MNPGFENPPGVENSFQIYEAYIPGAGTTNSGGSKIMQGWFSTHPAKSAVAHPIEVWDTPFNVTSKSAEGDQHIELNADVNSAVYQDLCVFQGEQPRWYVSHRGRSSSADVAEVFISNPASWSGTTFSGTKDYSAQMRTNLNGSVKGFTGSFKNDTGSNSVSNVFNEGWVTYSGQWNGALSTGAYRFAFQSISTGSGNSSVGNFLDNIKIELSPTVEFVNTITANGVNQATHAEDNVYYLTIRLNGEMRSAGTINIGLKAGSTINKDDYVVTGLNNGTNGNVRAGVLATEQSDGTIQVNIPAGTYNVNEPSDYITIGLNFADSMTEPTENASFELKIQAVEATLT